MAHTIIRDVMRMLSPDRPIMQLARLAGCPRPTAKSWATGHRRPPIYILTKLREVVRDRPTGLEGELDYEISKREFQPKLRTGFNEIRERDGPGSIPRDGRNRRGRPQKRVARNFLLGDLQGVVHHATKVLHANRHRRSSLTTPVFHYFLSDPS